MKKKWMTAAFFLLLLFVVRVQAGAEEIQEPGMPAALERARIFNEWVQQHTVEEIADCLQRAGFSRAEAMHHIKLPWMAVVAQK